MASSRALVVWCPDWPLAAIGVDPAVPAAVADSGRVVACTASAREAGVRRGHRLRDAQRHCPQIAVHHSDQAGEARAFETVVGVVEEICPRVEVVRPGVAAVPARGPSRYYGSEQVVAGMVRDAVIDRGFACAVGVADGTFTASLAARAAWGDSGQGSQGVQVVVSAESATFLAPLPVSTLDMPELASVLGRLGLRTLGSLAALPVRDVLSRFGVAGEVAHRLASGRRTRPPATRPVREDLGSEMEFDPPVDLLEPVVFVAKSLADYLHENLATHGLVCVRIEIEAVSDDGRSRSRLWRHDGLLSSLAVAERVRWQLDAWRASGELAGHLACLRLTPDQVVVDTGRQQALWGERQPIDQVARAAMRVQALLGHAAVTRPSLTGGRGPAEQVVRVPWGEPAKQPVKQLVKQPWPGQVPTPAPAAVPPQPGPVDVMDAAGSPVLISGRSTVSAPPAQLVLDGRALKVTGWTGPWPVLERWWDAAAARRFARLQVVTDDGRAWLLVAERRRWAVEGEYR